MRTMLLIVVGVMTIGTLALPQAGYAQTSPPVDSLTVSGHVLFTRGLVNAEVHDVTATSGPSGEAPSGRVLLYSESPSGAIFQVFGSPTLNNVTCLGIDGNVAVVGFQDQAGTFFIQYVDNDVPGSPATADFAYRPIVVPGRAATDCSALAPGSYPDFLEIELEGTGDVVIQDAPPVPTSKEQCKNGGWQAFGIFNNQGACVSFVRHQARQECIFIRAAHGQPAFRAWYGSEVHKRHAMRRCIRQRSGG